ncbi:hypothetical protein [Rickettsia endosymbiont of Ceutorhynchus obstrictus]|uniref:hypothetical protein n=1 Tax=Rickettsia endosymbiont of Ceutorhynchus obstrictus TaxID=3066249 RepID=UPI003132C07A
MKNWFLWYHFPTFSMSFTYCIVARIASSQAIVGVVAWLIIYHGYYKYSVMPWSSPLLYER